MIRKLAVDFDITQLKWNEQGIIPAVIQDRVSKQVLMVAYMNQESLSKTIETGETWFYSRSRQELWHKGKTSGHFQKITELQIDCDQDTLLIQVEQIGVACHTGTYTCFGEDKQDLQNHSQEGNNSLPILDQLITLIAEREKTMPEGSYTTYLFEKGLDKILKKVGEEASEVIIAAKNQQPEEVVSEASDLIYHLLVLLQQQGISFDRVLKELARRHQDQSSDVKFIRQRK